MTVFRDLLGGIVLLGLSLLWALSGPGAARAMSPDSPPPSPQGGTAEGPAIRVGSEVQILASDQKPFRVPIFIRHGGGSNAVHIGLDYDELMMRFRESWSLERAIGGTPWKWSHDEELGAIQIWMPFDAARGGREEEALLIELEFQLNEDLSSSNYGYRASAQVSIDEASTYLEDTLQETRSRPKWAIDGSVTVYLRDMLEVGSARLTPKRQVFRVPLYVTHLLPEDTALMIGLDYDELFLDLLRVDPVSSHLEKNRLQFDDPNDPDQKPWIEAHFREGTYPALLRHHLLDLVFEYRAESGVPAKDWLEIVPRLSSGGRSMVEGGGRSMVVVREGTLYVISPRFIRGDSDGSGKVEMTDALVILDYVFQVFGNSEPPSCLDALNADASDRVEITDAILLLDYFFRGGRPPSMPFPEPGPGPTGTPILGCASEVPDFELLPLTDRL